MKDTIVVATLLLAFATFVTVHVVVAVRLLRATPRWRGLLALVVLPLALLWAIRAGWRKTAALWFGSVLVYLVALLAAQG